MNNINILWFTNTVSGARDYLKQETKIGGWIESLEKNLKMIDGVNLGVAFYWGNAPEIKKIVVDKTTYFIIPDRRSKIKKGIHKHFHNIKTPNEIENYLEIIDKFNPDIINIFGTENSFGLLISHTKIPVVIHLQGILTVYLHKWFSSGLDQLKILKSSSLIKLLKGTSLFHKYYYYKHAADREKLIIKSCMYFNGRTAWDRRIVYLINPAAKYFHIDEILREEFYQRKWISNNHEKYKIFSTIQGNIYKGLETVLETAEILSKFFELVWNIAGIDSTEEIVRVLEKKYKKSFKNYNINFLGQLNVSGLIDEMLASDLFVHPSHIDNSPNSVCEAMMLGMPIIATASGGTPSILKNDDEGILIQDGDPFSLAGTIIEVKKNPFQYVRMGENARARALIRHDHQKIVGSLICSYNAILKESGSSKSIKLLS
jgi:glycosyltransferase involved in cell wall biosynthesis